MDGLKDTCVAAVALLVSSFAVGLLVGRFCGRR